MEVQLQVERMECAIGRACEHFGLREMHFSSISLQNGSKYIKMVILVYKMVIPVYKINTTKCDQLY